MPRGDNAVKEERGLTGIAIDSAFLGTPEAV